MADTYEIDLDITAEAKDRLKRAFTESLVSAEVERLKEASKSVGQKRLDTFTGGAGKVAGAVNAGSSALGGSVGGIGAMFGPEGAAIGAAIDTVTSALGKAVDTMKSFVGAFNPAIIERYDQVLNDISGVIGRTLSPLFERIISATRVFGDFLNSIMPNLEGLASAFDPIIDGLRGVLGLLAGPLKFGLQVAVEAMTVFVKGIATIPQAINWALSKLPKFIQDRIGLNTSVGAGNSGARQSSISGFGESLQLAAFGMAGPANDAKRTADATEDIAKNLGIILGLTNPLTAGPTALYLAGQALGVS